MAKLAPPLSSNEPLQLPPHANAEVHKQIMAHLAAMTSEEFLETLVRSGICTPEGKLTDGYAGNSEDDGEFPPRR